MPWNCPSCRESIDDTFDTCWNCGTGRDGSVDADFQHADDYEPPIPEQKPQFSIWTLLRLVTLLCLVFALFGYAATGAPPTLILVLGLVGVGLLFLELISWRVLRRVYSVQRWIRASQRSYTEDAKSSTHRSHHVPRDEADTQSR
jgi:hypothetical protein